jgi:phospholipid/cholesterol/gamma-HCH transport system substrate-binding protein
VKKTNMEFMVGGFILIALFIAIAGVLWLKSSTLTRSMVEYTVIFPNIGTLSEGDPVMANGVRKGVVGSVSLVGAKVHVVMKIDKSVPITDSSKITVQNIGLMGERMLGVLLSDRGKVLRPSKKGSITVIYGNFDSGIAEAMGMIGTVMTDVRSLIADVASIVDSTVGDTSFFRTFKHIVDRLDTVTVLAQSLVANNRPKIDRSVSNITTVTSDLKQLLDSNKAQLNTIVSNGTELSSRAVTIVTKVDSLAMSLQTMVSKIQQGQGSIGLLMNDEQFYRDLKKSIADLDSLVNEVQTDGLKLRLKLGFKKEKKKAQ